MLMLLSVKECYVLGELTHHTFILLSFTTRHSSGDDMLSS